jgi:hypothetical protein
MLSATFALILPAVWAPSAAVYCTMAAIAIAGPHGRLIDVSGIALYFILSSKDSLDTSLNTSALCHTRISMGMVVRKSVFETAKVLNAD